MGSSALSEEGRPRQRLASHWLGGGGGVPREGERASCGATRPPAAARRASISPVPTSARRRRRRTAPARADPAAATSCVCEDRRSVEARRPCLDLERRWSPRSFCARFSKLWTRPYSRMRSVMLLRHLHHVGFGDVGEHMVLAVLAVGALAAVALGGEVLIIARVEREHLLLDGLARSGGGRRWRSRGATARQ